MQQEVGTRVYEYGPVVPDIEVRVFTSCCSKPLDIHSTQVTHYPESGGTGRGNWSERRLSSASNMPSFFIA